jgi:spore germination cell wall hydrolase CwlJ-like protein
MLSSRIVMPALRLPTLPEAKTWLSSIVLATTAALYLVAALSVSSIQPGDAARANVRGGAAGLPSIPGLGTPPAPEPLQFRDVAPQDAVAINDAVPISTAPNPAARPFRVSYATPADRLRAVECLTAAVYYEAGVESTEGQRAVAQVVLNRARHPAYPKSVCGVVFQGSERTTGCQFTFTCDGAIYRQPSTAGWARARAVAEQALAGQVYAPVGWATHYHTNWVVPYWSSSLVKAAQIGTHIFYRWEGGWGRPGAFRFGIGGGEPQIALMRRLTSDPTSLAQAQEIDKDAAAAALAAAAAAAAANPDLAATPPGAVPAQGSIDSFHRAVLRRYEPMTRETATDTALARNKEPVSSTLHWALSGLPEKPQAGLGKNDAAAPAAAAAAPPKCLEGVRRAPVAGQAAPEKQAC